MVTKGLIDVDVKVVEPSAVATEIFQSAAYKNTCENIDNSYGYGSYIAAAVMPQMASFDKIIGYSLLPACNQSPITGSALMGDHRYADILGSDPLTNQLTGTHELLHLYGLGHSGELLSNSTDLFGNMYPGNDPEPQFTDIDLDAYVRKGSYFEYGSPDIMGSVSGVIMGQPLNPVHEAILDWTHRFTHRPETVPVEDLADGDVSFSITDTDPSTVVVLQLRNPLNAPQTSTNTEFGAGQVFNWITFTPYINGTLLMGVTVSLSSEENSAATLGPLVSMTYGDVKEFHLSIGGEKITAAISLTDQRVTLTHTNYRAVLLKAKHRLYGRCFITRHPRV